MISDAAWSADRLVLVSAPVGSGKSTAIANWVVEESSMAVAWMQIDESDNDSYRFWRALVAGLSEHQPTIKDAMATPLTQTSATFVDSVLPALVYALDTAAATVIVLDDYHLITEQTLHDQVAAFIDACPEHITVVISTRIDPPLHLGRLRVRGQLREVRASDLRFDAEEAATMFDGLDVSAEEVALMCERTEGWAAGLVLAALSLSRAPDPASFVKNFAGNNRMVVDYLTTELWDTIPEDVRDVFVNMSILDTMSGPLVDALMETDGQGAGWLEDSARDTQLVMALDEHGGSYRYHHLLQDLLRSTLEQEFPKRIPVLHARAAQWYASTGDDLSAIGHTLGAGDMSLAAELIATHGSRVCSVGKVATVQDWLTRLGDATVSSDPALSSLLAWTMVIDGDWAHIDEVLESARQLLGTDPRSPEGPPMVASAVEAASTMAEIARGDIASALQTIESVTTQPQRCETTVLVRGVLGMTLTWRGQPQEAIEELEWVAAVAPEEGEHLLAAMSLLFLAIIACAHDDSGRAEYYARAALDHADQHGLSEYNQLALAHSMLARTTATSDLEKAMTHAARGVHLARRANEPIALAFALVANADVFLNHSEETGARPFLVEARNILERCPDPGIVLTMLARSEARLGGANRLLGALNADMLDPLTDRELTILRLLPSTLSAREIAGELFVSHNTVKGHVKAVYRKLGVNDRSVAVQRAREMNLL